MYDSCITQVKARGPSRTCNESKEEDAGGVYDLAGLRRGDDFDIYIHIYNTYIYIYIYIYRKTRTLS